MARPIKMTEELVEKLTKDFRKRLTEKRLSDGKIEYSKSLVYNKAKRAEITFAQDAYLKMIMLIMKYDTEVGWYGVGRRTKENKFYISDILVYPQKVTGYEVDTVREEYAEWIRNNGKDERFFNIIMQGHSHVRMSTSPSGTDLKSQEDVLNLQRENSFYIFLIMNKSLESSIWIYDLKNNILYNTNDIDIQIECKENCDITSFLKESEKLVIPVSKQKSTKIKGCLENVITNNLDYHYDEFNERSQFE